MATSEEFIDTFYRSISDLHSVRNSLDNEYGAGLMKILQSAAKDISDHTGEFLHALPEKKPDEDTLQKMISASPSSLNYKNDTDDLPIHKVMYHPDSIRYVPLLAREGVKHKVGGNDGRGGLLVVGSTIPGVLCLKPLQSLLWMRSKDNPYRDLCDKACVDAMKKLKDGNLLTKEDIKNHGLFTCCCFQGCKQRFEFLCNWYPEGLKELRPIMNVTTMLSIKSFAVFLKASTKSHYQEAGLLFQTDTDGITACQRAFDRYGKEETMQVIGNCIPFDDPQIPILHHVAKHAIRLLNDFRGKIPLSCILQR